MEMYAERKGWDLTGIEVDCDYAPAERGRPTQFNLVLRLPESLRLGCLRQNAHALERL